MFKTVAVYCGSHAGHDKTYQQNAELLGRCLVDQNITLIYGGGRVGLMGAIADSVLAAGGEVIGIIPEDMKNKEIAHDGLSQLQVEKNFHQRKQRISELAEAFILMPGGPGSFEEFFEIWTWTQLGYLRRPLGILNTLDFYQPLLSLADNAAEQGFMQQQHRDLVCVDSEPQALLNKMQNIKMDFVAKWHK